MIWLAHIGIDRALGYGLKYSTGFGFTHLGRIGKERPRRLEPRYFSPTLNGGSLPGGVVSSAIASIIATMT